MIKTAKVLTAVLIGSLCVLKSVAAGERQSYSAYLVESAITIDGDLGDAAWQTIPQATGFKDIGTHKWTVKQTHFRIGWDKNALYVAIKCEEPDVAKIQGAKDHDNMFSEDSIEIFVAPEFPHYIQLAANSEAIQWQNRSCKWEAAVTKGDDYWAVEVKVPFVELKKTPEDKDVWRFNIAKNTFVFDSGGDKSTTWSPLVKTFHDTAHFSDLKFVSQILKPAGAAKIAKESNRELFGTLIKKITITLNRCEGELANLRKAGPEKADAATVSEFEKDIADLKTIAQESALYTELKAAGIEAQKLWKRILVKRLKG